MAPYITTGKTDCYYPVDVRTERQRELMSKNYAIDGKLRSKVTHNDNLDYDNFDFCQGITTFPF